MTLRQVIIAGEAREAVTGRALSITSAALRLAGVPIPAILTVKPGGYFGLHLDVQRHWPTPLPSGDPLRLEVTLNDSITLGQDLPRADLVPGGGLLPTAPWDMNHRPAPVPPALHGTVLLNGDAARPGAFLTVTPNGGAPVTADAEGRFRLATLPAAPTAPLTVSSGPESQSFTHITDFATPINRATFAFAPD